MKLLQQRDKMDVVLTTSALWVLQEFKHNEWLTKSFKLSRTSFHDVVFAFATKKEAIDYALDYVYSRDQENSFWRVKKI